jgi:hypothetical protein
MARSVSGGALHRQGAPEDPFKTASQKASSGPTPGASEPLHPLRSGTKGQAEPARTGFGPSPARCGRSRSPNCRAGPQTACVLRVRSDGDRWSIAVTRRHALAAPPAAGQVRKPGQRSLQAGAPTVANTVANTVVSYRHETTSLEHRPRARTRLDGAGQLAQNYGSEGWGSSPSERANVSAGQGLAQGVSGALNLCPGPLPSHTFSQALDDLVDSGQRALASSVVPGYGPPGTRSAARPTCAAAAEPGRRP